MLQKAPNDRYQSTRGILSDIEYCIKVVDGLTQNGGQSNILESNFVPGNHDVHEVFKLPNRIYGRDNEVKLAEDLIIELLSKTDDPDFKRMLIVSGYSGSGKSSIINEVRKRAFDKPALFCSGKFESSKLDRPYSAIVDALSGLVDLVLLEGNRTMQFTRNRLNNKLKDLGAIVTDVFPRLKLLIGEPSIPQISLGHLEKKNVFNALFISCLDIIIDCLSKSKQLGGSIDLTKIPMSKPELLPLIFILDDLQWCDTSSFELLEKLVTKSKTRMLFVCAHRSNETPEGHPFRIFLSEMEKKTIPSTTILVGSLGLEAVVSLVCDTLSCDRRGAQQMAAWILQKGQGNPLFITRYLSHLFQENFIKFDHLEGQWKWDIQYIKSKSVPPSDIVQFLLENIEKSSIKRILAAGACFGNQFESKQLAWLEDIPMEEVEQMCWNAEVDGYISHGERPFTYRFLHDKLLQASYGLNEEGDRKKKHLKIGQHLLEEEKKGNPQNVYDIAHHLNESAELIQGDHKIEAARWDLQAAIKARSSLSYQASMDFVNQGLKFLPPNSWEEHHDLTMQLHLEKGVLEFLERKNFEESERVFSLCIEHSNDQLHRLSILNIRCSLFLAAMKYQEMVDCILEFLKPLGFEIPPLPTDLDIEGQQSILSHQLNRLNCTDFSELIDRVKLKDDQLSLGVLELLGKMVTAAFFTNPKMLQYIAIRIINMCMNIGFRSTATVAVCWHAFNVSVVKKDYKTAFNWSNLAKRMCQEFDFADKGQALCVITFSRILGTPLLEVAEIAKLSFETCLAHGDMAYAGYAAYHYLECLWIAGINLEEFKTESTKMCKWVEQAGNADIIAAVTVFQPRVRDLLGLKGELTEEEREQKNLALSPPVHALFYGTGMRYLYLMNQHEKLAKRVKVLLEGLIFYLPGLRCHVEIYFYWSLSMMSQYHKYNIGEKEKKEIIEKCEENLKSLQLLAESMPKNFSHRANAVALELMRIKGEKSGTALLELYKEVVEEAKRSGSENDFCIISELMSSYASEYASELTKYSVESYLKNGNQKKAEIVSEYPPLVSKPFSLSTGGDSRDFSRGFSGSAELDLETVVKSSQEISSVTDLDDLIRIVLTHLVTSSGSTKGALLTVSSKNPDELELESIAVLSSDSDPKVSVDICRTPLQLDENSTFDSRLCLPLVNYSWRGGGLISLSLDQSGRQSKPLQVLQNDPYVNSNGIKSLFCAPFDFKGTKHGVIYLESKSAGTFKSERIRIINILVSQLVISLQNAHLVKQLSSDSVEASKKNEELTTIDKMKDEFLATTSHELRTPLSGILGMTSLIQDTNLNAEQMDCVGHIQNSAEILNELVNDIIEVSKLKARKVHIENKPISIVDVVESSIGVVEFRALYKGLNLAYFIDEKVPDTIVSDRSRVQQVLVNLLNNAIKFSTTGDVIVRVLLVWDSMENENKPSSPFKGVKRKASVAHQEYVRFEVEDTGVGITPENARVLFKPFSQVEGSNRRQAQGTGLGLHICRQLVQLMNGKIWLEKSAPNRGSTFSFQIPCLTMIPEACSNYEEFISIPDEYLILHGKKAIVFLDNATNTQIISDSLLKEHCASFSVESPEQLKKSLEKEDPTILFLDTNVASKHKLGDLIISTSFKGMILMLGNALESRNEHEFAISPPHVLFLKTPLKQSQLLKTLAKNLDKFEKDPKAPVKSVKNPVEDNNNDSKPFTLDMKLPSFQLISPGGSAENMMDISKATKILLVEDNALNRKVVIKMLDGANYRVESVVNGKLAVEAIDFNHYDAILMDIQMPVMDGLQATEIIRQKEALRGGKKTPILGLSASVSEHDQKVCLDVGMNDFIGKPLRKEVLLSKLERCLKRPSL
eukprot:TRINITY_DN3100_c0_g1_i2.p1 TRINITY_DN3100_c0_g1~~TRINITY_DN3100_c0_g1_i2.p1  ORF type:complete len:1858 (+),score=570.56 TRINITY_DN3100_c0_g1_i2:913-6486(+)